MLYDKSESNAWLMLDHYVKSVTNDLGDQIKAILLTGSLATGSYVPGPGDVDQITILDDSAPRSVDKLVNQHIKQTMDAFNGAIHIAETLYRTSDLRRPWQTYWDLRPETKHFITTPEELLRIHDHGQTIWCNEFNIGNLPVPTMHEIIDYTKRWRIWDSNFFYLHPELMPPDPMPVRLSVQSLLSSATMHYYLATGKTCFNKHQIADKMRDEVPSYRFHEGLRLATEVRLSGFTNVSDEVTMNLNEICHELIIWKRSSSDELIPLIGY